jgi:hypothetical protein
VDLNKNAHRIVRALTEEKGIAATKRRGRIGGFSGGPARAAALTPEQRKAIALRANSARWKQK